MGKSLSSDSARTRWQKQQKEAWRHAAPDARERIPTGAYGAALERSVARALSTRMRWTSLMACGFWCAGCADGTISSDFAPSICELQYGTTPSLELGASPLPRSPMMV